MVVQHNDLGLPFILELGQSSFSSILADQHDDVRAQLHLHGVYHNSERFSRCDSNNLGIHVDIEPGRLLKMIVVLRERIVHDLGEDPTRDG